MRFRLFLAAGAAFFATTAGAQAAAHVALGDKEYAAMHASAALAHYREAIKADSNNYDALWKAARSAVDLASFDVTGDLQTQLYADAELYARRAVAANPGDAEGRFSLARALGKRALTLGIRQRVKYATDIRDQAVACLKISPKHAGCDHVMGMWNAEVMRLNGVSRMIAKNFLGGKAFGSASWTDAQRYMEESIANEPSRIVHYVDAAGVYRDRGNKAKAKEMYEIALRLENSDYNDRHYKAQAEAGLKKL